MRPLLSALSLAALIATGALPAHGQISLNAAALPADGTDITGTIAGPVATYFQMAPVQSNGNAATVVTQRRFPMSARQLRLDGEMASREMPVYIRAEQVGEQARIKIRYINSVTTMPEASRITISVNDTVLSETAIEAATEHSVIEAMIPAGLLEAGFNAVKISVQQRHRVDCTIEATDELWTQVDPVASGIFLTSTKDTFSRIDDLVALPLDVDGSAPINVVVAQGADTKSIDRAIRAAQAVAVRAGIQTPKITFSRELGGTSGIQLIVGSTTELRSRGFEANMLADNSLSVSGQAGGVVRVTLSGATVEDIDQTIDRIVAEKPAQGQIGSTAGLRAWQAQKAYALDSEGSISLRDMGIPTQEFNGRLFRLGFDVVLPADFYPADNGKATLVLDAAYAAGLLTTNEAIVRINGRVVGATRLTRSGGEVINQRPIEMSLRALQPGYNSVTLEVRTATEADKDCNPLSVFDAKKRLMITDQTTFKLPRLARVAHLPNMGATASTGFPFANSVAPVALYMPKPDFATLGTAATMLARAAITAGRPIQTRISLTPPDSATGNAFIVGAVSDIPTHLIEHFGIQKDALPATWTKRVANPALPRQPDQMKPVQPLPRAAPDKVSRAPADTEGLVIANASFKENAPAGKAASAGEPIVALGGPTAGAAQDSDVSRMMQSVSGFLQRTVGYSNEQLSFLNGGKTDFVITKAAKLIVAQQQALIGSKATWMLVMAPDVATLQKEMAGLVSPNVWMQLSGRGAAFDPAVADLNIWPVNSSYFYALQDRSFANVTLFAAGWLSNNVQYYVLVILALCSVFGLFTRKILNRIGVQP